jgi:3-oxoacyl-[acyl-carrier protein] reductase
VNLTRKRILVTASTKGIGRGVARALLKKGAKVLLSSRSAENVSAAVRELRTISDTVWGFPADLTDLNSLEVLVEEAQRAMGGVDVLVMNSGNPEREPATFTETTMEDWEYAVKLYLLSSVKLVKLLYPQMVERRWGRVIFLSSYTVKEPQEIFSLADVSRAPLMQLCKVLARELGKYGLTFNVVLMGSFRTPGALRTISRLAQRRGEDTEEVWKREVESVIPAGRVGDIEGDLGELVAFLASDSSAYINGSYITIDGGLTRAL